MKKFVLIFCLANLIFTSCDQLESEVKSIKASRCVWCSDYGAGPVVYYENGIRKESKIKFCSQKCLMEYSESHNQ